MDGADQAGTTCHVANPVPLEVVARKTHITSAAKTAVPVPAPVVHGDAARPEGPREGTLLAPCTAAPPVRAMAVRAAPQLAASQRAGRVASVVVTFHVKVLILILGRPHDGVDVGPVLLAVGVPRTAAEVAAREVALATEGTVEGSGVHVAARGVALVARGPAAVRNVPDCSAVTPTGALAK